MTDWNAVTGGNFHTHTPANATDVATLEASLNVALPSDYKEFLQWSNGGEGDFGGLYVAMWPTADVVSLNELYSIRTRMGHDFIGVGTDGGDYCFAVDLRNNAAFVVVPLGALADDEVKRLADSFIDGLTAIRDGTVTGDDL
jgi:hypothetical protein